VDHPNGKAYLHPRQRSCNKAQCPVCWEGWRKLEATRATRRLGFYRGAYKRPIHVIIAPPSSLWHLEYRKLRARAYRVAKAAGLLGGCVVFHPSRDEHDVWSPHFHVVGFGWIRGDQYERTGWVVKNLGLRKSVYGTIKYELGHAGIDMGEGILRNAKSTRFQTTTWFGCCSYNVLKVPKEKPVRECCPVCKRELVRVIWLGDGDPPTSEWQQPENWQEVAGYSINGAGDYVFN
jgi:hypothetical protein